MFRTRACFSIAFLVVSLFCITSVAKGNIIINWDFSNGLAGWQIVGGDVIATNYSDIPIDYKNTWDLSNWDNKMDGGFALTHNHSYMSTSVGIVTSGTPYSLSFDYAVAWSYVPENTTDLHPYGYFYVTIDGLTSDGIMHHGLGYKEVDWYASGSVAAKDVFTGSVYYDNFIQWPNADYKELFIDLGVFNPNISLEQIVGIDNITLSVVPTPVPSPFVLLGVGLACLSIFSRKLKRS